MTDAKNEADSGASHSDAGLDACPHGCKEAGDCISPVEWCPHTPDGCYPEEWGPSDNRRLTCSYGNPDPEHMDKVPKTAEECPDTVALPISAALAEVAHIRSQEVAAHETL